MHLAHVGDTRIYRLRQGKFEQVTRDHSLINLYEDNPELAARFGPPNSNVIVRAVGLRDQVEVDHRVIAMEPGDMYLLCCDGLTDMVDDWMLKEMLSDAEHGSLDEACDALVRAALSNGGVDNTTVILLGSTSRRSRGQRRQRLGVAAGLRLQARQARRQRMAAGELRRLRRRPRRRRGSRRRR